MWRARFSKIDGGMRSFNGFRPLVIAAGLALAAGLAACGNGPPAGSGGSSSGGGGCTSGTAGASLGKASVKVDATDQLQFSPTAQSVKTGQVVEWDNTGSVLHNITFDNPSCFTDSSFQPGGKWQVKFTAPGTYSYHCTIHPGMDGKITVG